jgi:hypothetical protein
MCVSYQHIPTPPPQKSAPNNLLQTFLIKHWQISWQRADQITGLCKHQAGWSFQDFGVHPDL